MRGSLAVSCLRNDSVPTRLASQPQSPSSLHGWQHLPRRTLLTLRLSTGGPDTDTSGWHLAGSAREYLRKPPSYVSCLENGLTISCGVSIWVYFYLPEVKDRTLEEIDEMVSRHHDAPEMRCSESLLTWILGRPSSRPWCRLASSAGTCVSVAQGVRARRRAPDPRWLTPKILSGRMGRWLPKLALLLPEQVTSLQPVQVVPSTVNIVQ